MKEPGIKPLDSPLCISTDQKENFKLLRQVASEPTKTYWKYGYCFSIREDDPMFEEKMASSEEPPKFLADRVGGAPRKTTTTTV